MMKNVDADRIERRLQRVVDRRDARIAELERELAEMRTFAATHAESADKAHAALRALLDAVDGGGSVNPPRMADVVQARKALGEE